MGTADTPTFLFCLKGEAENRRFYRRVQNSCLGFQKPRDPIRSHPDPLRSRYPIPPRSDPIPIGSRTKVSHQDSILGVAMEAPKSDPCGIKYSPREGRLGGPDPESKFQKMMRFV